MSKKIKIKIKINGKPKIINEKTKLSYLIRDLKVPLNKVAIELNREIINKKNLKQISLKKNDQIEIVHFIGGG
jgi:thiamine biosynthesis protein ThiS